jgi:hypothetical protein
VLRQDQGDRVCLGQNDEGFAIHGYGESEPPLSRQPESSCLHRETEGGSPRGG